MSILQSIKKFSWLVLLALVPQAAVAFSPGGPIGNGGDAWQTAVIGYGLAGDLLAPKNIGEEYRRNTPVMYYAYDANFIDYFGSNGVAAVDGAFGVMNGLSNVDYYSSSLSEFPQDSQSYNFTAQTLGLTDLKSATLGFLMEQMGLADPVRYDWTLHGRVVPPGCPITTEYEVVQRNFDTISLPNEAVEYSPFVNGTLYTYYIVEDCGPPDPEALAIPSNVDPFDEVLTPVSSYFGDLIFLNQGAGPVLTAYGGLPNGYFYTGLTRDDVMGLRYLLSTNNINWETAAAGSELLTASTNYTGQELFPTAFNSNGVAFNGAYYGTADLGALINASMINNAAGLQALYPGLLATTVSNYFGLATITNVTAYYTNYIGAPAGSPPVLLYTTNLTYVPMEYYVNSFGNVYTNHYYNKTHALLVTTYAGQQIGAPAGSPFVLMTNIQPITLNEPSGDFYLLPAVNPCGVSLDIVYTLMTNVIATTNVIVDAGTNINVATNLLYTQSLVTYLTNYIYVANPVTCTETADATGLYGGIENVKFVKTSYDSLIGQFFQPITNNYAMEYVTNSQATIQHFQRIITTPDILFSASDQAAGVGLFLGSRNVNFDEGNVLPGLAGPGVINPPTEITYDKVGPVFFNGGGLLLLTNLFFYGEWSQSANLLAWASYDASTNTPVIYPDGASIQNLENQVLLQISPTSLPDGTNNVPYTTTTFTTTGGAAFTAPYTWSVLASAPLPQGLSLVSNPDNTATLSGTPANNAPGTYDFVLQMTDVNARSVQWNYSITIDY